MAGRAGIAMPFVAVSKCGTGLGRDDMARDDAPVVDRVKTGTEVHRIWPGNGVPPGSESWDWQERTAQVPWMSVPRHYTRNVVIPTVSVHRPAKPNGTTLVVAPG